MPRRADTASDDPAMGSMDPLLHPALTFPEGDWEWFLARCAALEIGGLALQRSALERLYSHLVGVNRWLNLTSITDPRGFLHRHVLDSLALVGDPRLKHLASGAPCLDLGSGGGYPGLPLALLHPQAPWILADARRKKAEFLAEAAKLVGAHVSARHLRGGEAARAAPDLARRCQLVVSRAMASAAEVLAESAPLLRAHGHCIIYKGPAYAEEEQRDALLACRHLGYRAVSERRVTLDDGDGERVMAVFERL